MNEIKDGNITVPGNSLDTTQNGQPVIEDEAAICTRISNWFDESKRWMEARRTRWRKNEKLYFNDVPVQGSILSDSAMKLQFAIPFAVIETEMPIINDYFPSFDVIPREENDLFFADMMQKRKDQVCREGHFKYNALDTVKDNLIYGNGLFYVSPVLKDLPDGTKQYTNKLEFLPVDLFTWFPCPNSRGMDIMTKARYHIFAVPMHVDDIKRMYGKDVPAEGNLDDYRSFKLINLESATTSGDKNIANMALVKECYYYDANLEQYPNGRVTVTAGNTLLGDEAIIGSNIGFFLIANYKSPHHLFGIGEPEMIKTLKAALDQVMSSIGENINKTGNPQRKIKRSWLKDLTNKILGLPGEDIVVNSMDDVQWEQPPGLPASTFQYVEYLLKLVDVITGVQDVTQGRQPTGITAASAITALQNAAQTRIRYKIEKDVKPWIVDIGKYVIELLQMLDEEVISIRTAGVNKQYEFAKYDPTGMYLPDGQQVPLEQQVAPPEGAKTIKDTNFDIDVVAGIELPQDREANEEKAFKLFEVGALDVEGLLKMLNIPNRQDLIKNYDRKQQQDIVTQRIEGLNVITPEFEKLISSANVQNGEWVGSKEELQLAELLKEFPELLGTDGFQILDATKKQRLMAIFLQPKMV